MNRLTLFVLFLLVPATFAQDTEEAPPAVQISDAAKEELRRARDQATAAAARIRDEAYGAEKSLLAAVARPATTPWCSCVRSLLTVPQS